MQGRARQIKVCAFLIVGLISLALANAAGGAPGDATASQVADIRMGPFGSSPDAFFNAGGTLLFSANDGTNGTELWKSNGGPLGPGGTEMVEIAAGATDSNPANFADVNGTVFFSAADGFGGSFHDNELWKIAPPFTSPLMVKDIKSGGSSGPHDLINLNGTLLFGADDGSGDELWKSVPPYDTTSTSIVKNINTTTASTGSFPNVLTNVNGTLFFAADDGGGYELWKSEPPNYDTASTTKIDINPTPSTGSDPGPLVNANGTLLFNADGGGGEEFFKVAPPYTTAVQVKDINASGGSDIDDLTNLNGTVLFSANDGNGVNDHGFELWKSVPPYDAASTTVLDINPGSSDSDPFDITKVGSLVFFRAGDGVNGQELWKSNGGPVGAGTDLAADINGGALGSSPSGFADVGGIAFFRADAGDLTGQELWKSNGAGATLVRDINTTAPGNGSAPSQLTDVAGTLFFRAVDGVTGPEPWKATIEGPPATVPAPPTAGAVAGPTGQRAAALKKCKKKKSKKARKKCRKKAKRLPI